MSVSSLHLMSDTVPYFIELFVKRIAGMLTKNELVNLFAKQLNLKSVRCSFNYIKVTNKNI